MTRLQAVVAGLMLAALPAGCTVSTQPGPIWAPKPLAGSAPTAICLRRTEVAISGREPALEQHARALWLEALAQRRSCRPGDREVVVAIRGLRVATATGAYAPPAARGDVPRQATSQVRLTADAVVTPCANGPRTVLPLAQTAWVAYSADPYLADERARAALADLVARDVSQVYAALPRLLCRDAGTAATATTAATASAPATAAAAATAVVPR